MVPRNRERQANSSLEAARQEPRNRKTSQENFRNVRRESITMIIRMQRLI